MLTTSIIHLYTPTFSLFKAFGSMYVMILKTMNAWYGFVERSLPTPNHFVQQCTPPSTSPPYGK